MLQKSLRLVYIIGVLLLLLSTVSCSRPSSIGTSSSNNSANSGNSNSSTNGELPSLEDIDLTKEKIYYIDPVRGDDQAEGSLAYPWRSLKKACANFHSGVNLYLLCGSYEEQLIINTNSKVPQEKVLSETLKETSINPNQSFAKETGSNASLSYVIDSSYVRLVSSELSASKMKELENAPSGILIRKSGSYFEIYNNLQNNNSEEETNIMITII